MKSQARAVRLQSCIDYENTQKEKVKINGKTEEVNVPFLMLSGMILDDDKFKNVEVSNGKADQ